MPYGFAAAAGVSALGSVASGIIGSNASEKAASQQVAEQQQALALQKQIFGENQANVQPYVNSGANALTSLNNLLGLGPNGNPVTANPILQMLGIGTNGQNTGINPSTFTGSPGYQYELQQGQNAVTNAATRGPGGGNALLALQKNGQGLANQNWNQYLSNSSNAWQQLLSNISGQSQQGLNATGVLTGAGQAFANAAGGNLSAIGNAQSAGTIGGANALTGGIGSGLQSFNSLLTNPNTIASINSYINGGNASGSIPAGGSGMVPGGEGGGMLYGNGP